MMKDLIKEILEFRDNRNWKQFHNIKDLLIGLNIEVAELQELFLWIDDDQDKVNIENIESELADIFIFIIFIAKKYNIELEPAVHKKLKIHKEHYPIDKAKGKNTKYTNFKKNE